MAEPDDDEATNVTALFGVANLGLNYPVPEVLEVFERLHERAKKGEIIGVAISFVSPNRSIGMDWVTGLAPGNLMVSAVTQLQWRMLRDLSQVIDDGDGGDSDYA